MNFVPRSTALVVLNLVITFVVAAIGFGVGFGQGLRAQEVILYTIISAAVLFWILNYIASIFESRLQPQRETDKTVGVGGGRSPPARTSA